MAVREPAIAKEAVAVVASLEAEDEAIVAEVVVWVPAVAVSRPRATQLLTLSLPSRSRKLEPNPPKTRLSRKSQAIMQECQ